MSDLTRKSLTGRETAIIAVMAVLSGLFLIFFGLVPVDAVQRTLKISTPSPTVTHTQKVSTPATTITLTPSAPPTVYRTRESAASDVVTKTVTASEAVRTTSSVVTRTRTVSDVQKVTRTVTATKTLSAGPARTSYLAAPTTTVFKPRATITIRSTVRTTLPGVTVTIKVPVLPDLGIGVRSK